MKAVLMSIQPRWCELVANKKKLIEVRTTYPKAFLRQFFTFEPFKVYIYCTSGKSAWDTLWVLKENERASTDKIAALINAKDVGGATKANCKVIGEFICNKISPFSYDEHVGFPTPAYEGDPSFYDCGDGYWITGEELEKAQLTYEELCAYGKKKSLYGWHISDLIIYDEPKHLSDFETYNVRAVMEDGYPMPTHKIERAPQSWIYVKAA